MGLTMECEIRQKHKIFATSVLVYSQRDVSKTIVQRSVFVFWDSSDKVNVSLKTAGNP